MTEHRGYTQLTRTHAITITKTRKMGENSRKMSKKKFDMNDNPDDVKGFEVCVIIEFNNRVK